MPASHTQIGGGGSTQGHVSNTSPKPTKPVIQEASPNVSVSKANTGATTGVTTSTTNANPIVTSSGQSNVLNKYRSYNYNFTLSALSSNQANDPNSYKNSSLNYVVLKSGGKGTSGISKGSSQTTPSSGGGLTTNQGKTGESTAQKASTFDVNGLIDGFNQHSPGRFDMFIDNVEIETIMEFAKGTGATQPTKILFEVFEPYSINGFVEAIYTAAVAAGWQSYINSSFLLKMEFFGYTDDDVTPSNSPQKVEHSTRYFVFQFTGLEVDVTERGTKYKCSGVPIEQMAFGETNKLKQTLTAAGASVDDMLTDFMAKLNKQIVDADNATKSKDSTNTSGHDVYAIKFPTIDPSLGFNYSVKNNIAKAKIIEPNKDVKSSEMADPGIDDIANGYQPDDQKKRSAKEESAKPSSVASPRAGVPTASFADQTMIHECISSVIRDSEYLRKILADLPTKGSKVADENGMIDYFLVRVEVTNQSVTNDQTHAPYKNYTYVVTPYKIHYYKIPGYYDQNINTKNIVTLRNYDYVYTGNNIDILNFKMQFNTLFFESIPQALGNSTADPSKSTAAPTDNNDPKLKSGDSNAVTANPNPTPGKIVDASNSAVQRSGGNANQPSDDPYYKLARNMHEAVINSKASMITGEIEILGDPFYLVTGGIGNNNPTPALKNGVIESVGEGEAPYNYGQLFINIEFRNPIDIDPVTGEMFFDPQQVPFSGVYSVNTVNSSFREGKFTQKLQIIRAAGRLQDEKNKQGNDSVISKVFTSVPNPYDQTVADTTLANAFSARPGTVNQIIQSGRGLPNPGLPGQPSNFTSSPGALGGTPPPDMLPQVSGAVTDGSALSTAGADLFGGSIPGGTDQLATGIRMQQSGLSNLITQASTAVALANKINSIIPLSGVVNPLVLNSIAKVNAAVNLISVPGSGIGQGASVLINPQPVTVQSVSQATQTVSDLQSQTAVVPSNIAGVINQVGNKINSIVPLTGSSAVLANKIVSNANAISALVPASLGNTNSLANSLGINPSQLSGLSPNLTSKLMGQLGTGANNIPDNVDLSTLNAQGVDLTTIPVSKFSNLPASPPYSTAPAAAVDTQFLNSIAASEGASGLANVYGVTNISAVPASQLPKSQVQSLLAKSPSGIANPLNQLSNTIQGISPLSGSVATAASQAASKLNGVTDIANKFTNNSVNVSPLTKLLSG